MGIISKPLNEDELLSYEDFDRLSRVIQKHSLLRIDIVLQEDINNRLNLLRTSGGYSGFGDFDEDYRSMVLKANS